VEYIEFTSKYDVGSLEQNYLIGPIMGTEKNIFGLHGSMVRNSIELWANEEQKKHWLPKIDKYQITLTYGINFKTNFIYKLKFQIFIIKLKLNLVMERTLEDLKPL
jgi:hypothetical protein